jgi:cytochrome c oxidase assembly protein subunit 11
MNGDKNKSLAIKLGLVSLVMFGFGYALVPLYDVFCELTGLNGKTGRISAAQADAITVDTDRLITVEFDTNVNSALPWEFRPEQRKMQVHPGQVTEAVFIATNLARSRNSGRAVPSVAPYHASIYFNKTECFCFSEQPLDPGETRRMSVRFVVDPAVPVAVNLMTLSYTFFPLMDTVSFNIPGQPDL